MLPSAEPYSSLGVYDVYWTDYHPQFWTWAANGWDYQRLQQNIPYQSAAGSAASYESASQQPERKRKGAEKGTGAEKGKEPEKKRTREMWPALDGSGFYIQLHGTNPVSAVMALAMNTLFRSETEKGTGEPLAHGGHEVMGNHRGVFTSRYQEKAERWAAPLWTDKLNGPCTKICLIVTSASLCRSSRSSGGSRSNGGGSGGGGGSGSGGGSRGSSGLTYLCRSWKRFLVDFLRSVCVDSSLDCRSPFSDQIYHETAHSLKNANIKSFDQKLPGDPPGDRGPGTFRRTTFVAFSSIGMQPET